MAGSNSGPESSASLRVFGALVKFFRKQAGMTQEEFAPQVGYSVETVASIEQGRRLPSGKFVDAAERVLDSGGALKEAAKYLERTKGLANWFVQWAELEKEAICLYIYESRMTPGLLQVEPYAKTLFEEQVPLMSEEDIEEKQIARLERMELLTRRPNTVFCFIIEEHAIRRQIGGPEVHRAQIEHLLHMAEQRNVEIQVMPQSRDHHSGIDGPFQLLETPEHRLLAYSEGQKNGLLISDPAVVSMLQLRYARMRSQALSPEDSLSLLREIRGAV
ncbi:Scr1 family TA system antitoxin-like transcriptional regulator [Streptomyces laurentii]|uniref:helix-turn-helix domain-containing protein n=1 Tax=Streptomyces laurentii TaxID=39478 RepID=UPI003687053F